MNKNFNKIKGGVIMTNIRDNERIIIILMAALFSFMFLIAPSFTVAASPDVKVTIDGQYVSFPDQKPFIDSGRTLVPVRAPMEKLGCKVDWDEVKRQAIITKDGTTAVFTIGSKTYTINNVKKTMDVEPKIAGGRSVFPIRYCAEAFGANVGWNANTYTVIITSQKNQEGMLPRTVSKDDPMFKIIYSDPVPRYVGTNAILHALNTYNGERYRFVCVSHEGMNTFHSKVYSTGEPSIQKRDEGYRTYFSIPGKGFDQELTPGMLLTYEVYDTSNKLVRILDFQI